MLLLASTSDLIRVVTDAATTVSVHASYVDNASGTITPGRKNTAISTATTTTVVQSPSASTYRNVKFLVVHNTATSGSVGVTVQHTDGTTVVDLADAVLGPGGSLTWTEGSGWVESVPTVQSLSTMYDTYINGCMGQGNPNELMAHVQRAGWVGPTPTNIGTSVARCASFCVNAAITVNRIRYYGIGATTGVYQVALYRLSDLARLTAQLSINTASGTWGSAGSALAVTLSPGVVYFVACSVNATGTTAGLAAMGNTTTTTTGNIATAPGSLPGNLALGTRFCGYQFQFAVSTGALPATAATLAAAGAWTGGMPAFWIDAADV